ncbi:hypothetical protein C1H76_8736 [Elsinoe australis]|uniref:Uncharacterized protein n=1 Tax=Elsinoe australis TaxID=40998 RepID=A0A4U7AM39_9PEZI|nr:hypothetical protein C1H76_8736 [Elsinoe australis]
MAGQSQDIEPPVHLACEVDIDKHQRDCKMVLLTHGHRLSVSSQTVSF